MNEEKKKRHKESRNLEKVLGLAGDCGASRKELSVTTYQQRCTDPCMLFNTVANGRRGGFPAQARGACGWF